MLAERAATILAASAGTQAFREHLTQVATPHGLERALVDVLPDIGFEVFALISLSRAVQPPTELFATNFPLASRPGVFSDMRYAIDPLLPAVCDTGLAVLERDLSQPSEFVLNGRSFLAAAARAGFSQGLAIPFTPLRGSIGLTVFAKSGAAPVEPLMRPFAQDVGLLAAAKAGDLLRHLGPADGVRKVLSADERRVLIQVARGYSIETVAQQAELTPAVVRSRIRSARRKLGGPGGIRMVVRALYGGHITFHEALDSGR